MSKSKHTPGPWKQFLEDDGIQIVSEYDTVGLVRNSPRAEANARLIAAAPELLKALKNCVQYLDAGDYPENSEMRAAWEEAQKAIEKAEGVPNVKNK